MIPYDALHGITGTPEASERFLALVTVKDPPWFRPLLWVVYRLPGSAIIQRLDHWQTRRAVRLYRERKWNR